MNTKRVEVVLVTGCEISPVVPPEQGAVVRFRFRRPDRSEGETEHFLIRPDAAQKIGDELQRLVQQWQQEGAAPAAPKTS